MSSGAVGLAAADALLPSNAFALVHGVWRVAREIDDGTRIQGVAEITGIAHGEAHYQERVRVETAGPDAFNARQCYRFQQLAEGFAVRFADTGLVFHELRFQPAADGTLTAEAVHHCRADTYRSTYALLSTNAFRIEHQVAGPRKRYTIRTAFERAL